MNNVRCTAIPDQGVMIYQTGIKHTEELRQTPQLKTLIGVRSDEMQFRIQMAIERLREPVTVERPKPMLCLPAPKIAGLLPAPKLVIVEKPAKHWAIGLTLDVPGFAPQCKVIGVWTDSEKHTWYQLKHERFGVIGRKASQLTLMKHMKEAA